MNKLLLLLATVTSLPACLDADPDVAVAEQDIICPACTPSIIKNGGFEDRYDGWTMAGAAHPVATEYSHSGAYTGHVASGTFTSGYMQQKITIPASSATAKLRFYLNVFSDELGGTADKLWLYVYTPEGQFHGFLGMYSNLQATTLGDYKLREHSLDAYIGETIVLRFYATNDGARPTGFLVDDVSVIASAGNSL